MDTFDYIEEASRLFSPSGHELESSAWYRERFLPLCDEVQVDALYNVIALKKATRPMPDGKPAPKIMLAAHQDEIAMIVTAVLKDGTLRLGQVGGVDTRILPAAQVLVHAQRDLPGVVCGPHPKLLTDEEAKRNYRREELFVDVGLPYDEAACLVHIGDLVTFVSPAIKLLNHRISAKTMDDRACIGCLLHAAQRLQKMNHLCDIYFVASSQEEVGSKGAKTAAYHIDPDLAIALDVTHATLPKSQDDTTVPLNAPAVTCGPFIHHKLLEKLLKTAKDYGINVNTELSSCNTWTDADNIQIARGGVPSLLIDLPLKYMHTSVELLDMKVLEECGRLLAHFISDLDERWADELWI